MDAEGPGAAAPSSSSRCGCTTEQLLSRVQVRCDQAALRTLFGNVGAAL
jgi:hypothetical protein